MTIHSNRTLGGVGAIFLILGIISSVISIFLVGTPTSSPAGFSIAVITGIVSLFGFIGFILFLIAMNGFSKDYDEHRIFSYSLFGIIGTIIASVIIAVIGFAVLLLYLGSIFPNFTISSTTSIQSFTSPAVAAFSLAGIVWVVFIVKAFNLLAKKSEVSLFRTSAFVLLAGSVVSTLLNILFATLTYTGAINYNTYLLAAIPGGLTQNFAWALLAVAFFRIKSPSSTPTFTSAYVTVASGQLKYCPNCGTPNQLDAVYCTNCRKKL